MSSPLLKTGLLIDINNLFYAVQRKYGNRKLMILEYVKHLEKLGLTLVHKIAYSRNSHDQSVGFMTLLRNEGWEVHLGKTSWAIAMALRAADIVNNIDCFVLGTNFEEAGRILEWMKLRGKLTRCMACDIPPFFKQIADCTEITEAMLSGATKTA